MPVYVHGSGVYGGSLAFDMVVEVLNSDPSGADCVGVSRGIERKRHGGSGEQGGEDLRGWGFLYACAIVKGAS